MSALFRFHMQSALPIRFPFLLIHTEQEKLPIQRNLTYITKNVDMTPNGIIGRLNLRRPIFRKTTNYGHFGRNDKDFTWEKLDLVKLFKKVK